MMRIAFFGHDAGDAAVRRRVEGFRRDGLEVTRFMMRRSGELAPGRTEIDLGQTFDADYAQRIASIFAGSRIAASHRDRLSASDVIYARNLDMLATVFLTKALTGLKTPVVYECLDVHRLLTRSDPVGWAMRRLERFLLNRCQRLVVSSDAFIRNHFSPRYGDTCPVTIVENRMAPGMAYGPRPDAPGVRLEPPLRIGWVGVLRCARSLDLLTTLAERMGDRVRIHLHGTPALTEIPDFHQRIAASRGVEYHGRYQAPEDLQRIYSQLDLVWAGDFMEAGFNSLWLLPNRLYEGGYYGVPALAPRGTRTAEWIDATGSGFTLCEDLARTLPELAASLIDNPDLIRKRSERLLALPQDAFIQPEGELRSLIEAVLEPAGVNGSSSSTERTAAERAS